MLDFDDDEISLIKQNGQRIEKIRALVQAKTIFINDGSLPIEEGDVISRDLPNGLNERYKVLDRGFHRAFGPLEDHYQVKVQKESTIPHMQHAPVIYNLHGNNPRVNINSQDSSINITQITNENIFERIKQAIEENITEQKTRDIYLLNLQELRESAGSSSFLEKYQKFISVTANHISIIAPFIPVLTQLIKIS